MDSTWQKVIRYILVSYTSAGTCICIVMSLKVMIITFVSSGVKTNLIIMFNSVSLPSYILNQVLEDIFLY